MSKHLISETKNHFDSEYITLNSLIYKVYDLCHRMSSRCIGKGFGRVILRVKSSELDYIRDILQLNDIDHINYGY